MVDKIMRAESGASTANEAASSCGVVHPGGSTSEIAALWEPAHLAAGDEGSSSTFRLPRLATSYSHDGLSFPENDLLSLWLANHASNLHAETLERPIPLAPFADAVADPCEDSSFEDLGVYMQLKFPTLWADVNIPPCPISPPSFPAAHSSSRSTSAPRPLPPRQGTDQSPSSPLALHYASDESPTNSPWPATTSSSTLPLPSQAMGVQSERMIAPRSNEAVAPASPPRRELYSSFATASITTHQAPRMLSSDIHAANAINQLNDLATQNETPPHRTQMASVAPQGVLVESGKQDQVQTQTLQPTVAHFNTLGANSGPVDLNQIPASSESHPANALLHAGDHATQNESPAHRTPRMACVARQGLPGESGMPIQPEAQRLSSMFAHFNSLAANSGPLDLNYIPASSYVQAANAMPHGGGGFAAVPIYTNMTAAHTNHIQVGSSVGAMDSSAAASPQRRIHGSDPWKAVNLPKGFTSIFGLKPLPPNHAVTAHNVVTNGSFVTMPTIGRVPGYVAVAGAAFTPQEFSSPSIAHGPTRSWPDITNPSNGSVMTPAGRSPHVVAPVRPLPLSLAPNAGSMPFRYPRIDRRSLQVTAEASTERPSKRPNLAVGNWAAMGNHTDGNRYVRVSDPRPTLLYRPEATSLASTGAGWWRGGVGIDYYNASLPAFAMPTAAPPGAAFVPMEVVALGPALNTNGKPRVRRGAATDPQSVYARHRRTKITSRMHELQQLIPNGTKVDLVTMLNEAFNYVKFLEHQIRLLKSDENWMLATPHTYKGIRHSIL